MEQVIKLFYMIRNIDQSGISGTGKVVEGAILPSGRVLSNWLTPSSSTNIYDSIDHFKKAHIDPHPGCNELVVVEDESNKEDYYLPIYARRFCLVREANPEFKSLTLGRIINGVVFKNGIVFSEFIKPLDSITFYPSIDVFKDIHVNKNPDTNSFYYLDFPQRRL